MALPSKDQTKSADVELGELSPEPTREPRIEIMVDIDENGMVSARAKDLIGGKAVEMQIDYSRGVTRAEANQQQKGEK